MLPLSFFLIRPVKATIFSPFCCGHSCMCIKAIVPVAEGSTRSLGVLSQHMQGIHSLSFRDSTSDFTKEEKVSRLTTCIRGSATVWVCTGLGNNYHFLLLPLFRCSVVTKAPLLFELWADVAGFSANPFRPLRASYLCAHLT